MIDVVLIGARMHYAVPRTFNDAGILRGLWTDLYFSERELKCIHLLYPSLAASLRRYNAPRLAKKSVRRSILSGLVFRRELIKEKDYVEHIAAIRKLTDRLADSYIGSAMDCELKCLYAFDLSAERVFGIAKKRNIANILEQCVAPRSEQLDLYIRRCEELAEPVDERVVLQYQKDQRTELTEWDLATAIVCPSSYVKECIVKQGASEEKISILPYGVESPPENVVESRFRRLEQESARVVRVLFAGSVGYRKGALDLMKVAERCGGLNVEFRVAGHIEPSLERHIKAPKNVTLLGKLNKSDMMNEFSRSDIFFLPSYLEGSATVIYEAMGWGIPVVTTHNAGSVLCNGVDGFVCNPGDLDAMVDCICRFVGDKDLRLHFGRSAYQKVTEFSYGRYSQGLLELYRRVALGCSDRSYCL